MIVGEEEIIPWLHISHFQMNTQQKSKNKFLLIIQIRTVYAWQNICLCWTDFIIMSKWIYFINFLSIESGCKDIIIFIVVSFGHCCLLLAFSTFMTHCFRWALLAAKSFRNVSQVDKPFSFTCQSGIILRLANYKKDNGSCDTFSKLSREFLSVSIMMALDNSYESYKEHVSESICRIWPSHSSLLLMTLNVREVFPRKKKCH